MSNKFVFAMQMDLEFLGSLSFTEARSIMQTMSHELQNLGEWAARIGRASTCAIYFCEVGRKRKVILSRMSAVLESVFAGMWWYCCKNVCWPTESVPAQRSNGVRVPAAS